MQAINLHQKGDDFKATPDELRTIADKMKDPEFRKLWAEYTQSLQDPQYRKEEEEYLKQIEKEAKDGGDYSFDFIFPRAVFCIELLEGDGKTFVNICESEKVDEYREQPGADARGSNWLVPVSVGKPHDESLDGRDVSVYDAVFHPKTIGLASHSDRFMCFLVEIAVEHINGGFGRAFGFKFRRLPSSQKSIGTPANQTIRKEKGQSPFGDAGLPASLGPIKVAPAKEHSCQPAQAAPAPQAAAATALPKNAAHLPKYTILHKGEVDLTDAWNWKKSDKRIGVPKEIVVKLELPGVSRAADLDITVESGVCIDIAPSFVHPYCGSITLPFTVDPAPQSARFDKTKSVLTVTLKVIPPPMPLSMGEPESPIPAPTESESPANTPQAQHSDNSVPIQSTAAPCETAAPPTRCDAAAPVDPVPSADTDRLRRVAEQVAAARAEREKVEEKEQADTREKEAAASPAPAESSEVVAPSAQRAPATSACAELPSVAPCNSNEVKVAAENEPEVVDLRNRQRAWLEAVQQAPNPEKADVNSTPLDEEEENEKAREMKRKLKEQRRKVEAEKEAERLEAMMRQKMQELPLTSKYIFSVD